jgi:soluble lytic murein transglycosylase
MRKINSLWLCAFVLAAAILVNGCGGNGFGGLAFLGPTSTPTHTPTVTSPPPTSTPTVTPTPPPTPTPLPAMRAVSGDRAFFNGDWESALNEYTEAATGDDPDIQAAALVGIGRVHFQLGDYVKALNSFRSVISDYPDSKHKAQAFFHLGQIYDTLTRYVEAGEAYQNYISQNPGVIDAYVYELKGDSLAAAAVYPEALASYQAALQSDHFDDRIGVQMKLAQTYTLADDPATALVLYQDIYSRTTNDYTKARANYQMGQIYLSLGETAKAHAVFLDSVENYPLSYDSYLGLVVLVQSSYPVNELDRGLVNYYSRQYNFSVAALDRYLVGNPAFPDTALYFKGLSLRALGDYQAALEQWGILIDEQQASRHWGNAWEQKYFVTYTNLGDIKAAIQILLDFVETAPWHAKAAESLYRAGRDTEYLGDLEQAVVLWERVANEYTASEYAFRALFLAGISQYRLANYEEAQDAFERSLGLASTAGLKSSAYLWIGKSQQAQGNEAGARETWLHTASIDPTGYYSERARDLLADRSPFTPPAVIDLAFDRDAEKAQAEAWMRTTFLLSTDTQLSGPGQLAADSRFQRGSELWRLGLHQQARQEFENLRVAVEHDPVKTYLLANYFEEIGLYRSAILAARRVLTLAGMNDAATMNAPMHFNRIRFGTYYSDLIIPAAQKYDIHPFLFLSVMRQESFFESFIGSVAGARGLMQFMPATGQERAERLGWPPNYTQDDLYRPIVSITFGANYLDFTRSYLDGDLYGALAGYNGGPGNARAWKNQVPDDPDLYLEVIRFEETRRYIRAIYEMFSIYSRLYARTP